VAITSCGDGSGVSTTATGLAASLSETGDGNVLLVDMAHQPEAAQRYYRGTIACGLDEALEPEKRESALISDNLYFVAEHTNGEGPLRGMPKRFKGLVPKLKASDFDYIIFDLPPVNQVSITPRLARFMDIVLLVVELEKTNKESLKQTLALLRESQANVGAVLNKRRSYLPKWLRPEF
jgi:Mrp family chromosome partitioning ATPase